MAEWWGREELCSQRTLWEAQRLSSGFPQTLRSGWKLRSLGFISEPYLGWSWVLPSSRPHSSYQANPLTFSVSEQMFAEQSLVVSHSSECQAARVDSKTKNTFLCWSWRPQLRVPPVPLLLLMHCLPSEHHFQRPTLYSPLVYPISSWAALHQCSYFWGGNRVSSGPLLNSWFFSA